MNPFAAVAIIIAVFFFAGLTVGFLIVMALPTLIDRRNRQRAARYAAASRPAYRGTPPPPRRPPPPGGQDPRRLDRPDPRHWPEPPAWPGPHPHDEDLDNPDADAPDADADDPQ